MKLIPLIAFVICLTVTVNTCSAQGLFGQRQLGGGVSRRNSPAASSATPGSVTEGRRFSREARTVRDFVGGATAESGAPAFVGGNTAVTAAISSITGLREEVRVPLNRPRIIRPTGLYAERLSVSGDILEPVNLPSDAVLISPSLESLIQSRSVTIEVSREDRSATLRGAVPSEHDRQTTELLVMLEPGIQTVVNELTVDTALPSLQPSLRRSKSSQPPESR
jgi:hypothetical protein